ncbi:MAG: 50S ribosomal protein L1 [Bacillales bacterium]|jgi:large subunit ribosomal protein L1|nr:50S ribosomal protein L1 [Bacillales bacterium]
MKHGQKKYQNIVKDLDLKKVYTIEEAATLIKKVSYTKFDGTVSVQFFLGLDTRQATQQLRGSIALPNGTGKTRKVLAITGKTEEAKEAGADFVGGKELIEKIKAENWFDYDVIVATPEMMGELGKLGKLLGPKGLMPNPKVGTVTPNIGQAIQVIKKGSADYRTDKQGNLHFIAGKVSFETPALVENIKAIVDLVIKLKPATAKGVYVKNAVIAPTMGPSLKISV